MLIGLALILAAFVWLMIETNWLTIRLPVGAPKQSVNSTPETLALPAPRPILLLDVRHYQPSVFVAEDMPETSGSLQILSVRE